MLRLCWGSPAGPFCLNWDFWDFVVEKKVLRWVGVMDGGVVLWPLPFAPGHPHPNPLPPSGRGDTCMLDGGCNWWVWECR